VYFQNHLVFKKTKMGIPKFGKQVLDKYVPKASHSTQLSNEDTENIHITYLDLISTGVYTKQHVNPRKEDLKEEEKVKYTP